MRSDLLKVKSGFFPLLRKLAFALLVGFDMGSPHLCGIVQISGPLLAEGVPLFLDVREFFACLVQKAN